MENINKKFLFGIIFLFVIMNFSFSNISAKTLTSDYNVSYDSEIKGLFLIMEWVPVTVKIHDNTDIIIPKRDSVDFESKLSERTRILSKTNNAILSTLSKDEFQLERKFMNGNGFYGNITKEGFDKLLQDARVKKIHDNTVKGHIFSTKIKTKFFIYIIPILLIIALIILIIKLIKKRRWKTKK